MSNGRDRGSVLTVAAVLFAILAVSNATKAVQYLQDPTHLGIVIFGVRFESVASNAILGPLMGAVLAAYAYGLWTAFEADMPPGLYVALAGGVLFSLVVGIALMGLVFYSNRRGYDETGRSDS